MTKTKITIHFASALYERFMNNVDDSAIRRDAFIESVLRTELPRLNSAMEGKELSPKARRYVAKSLQTWAREVRGTKKTPGRMVLVNMSIAPDVADQLNDRVKKSNMCRDAFFNRLIMLLVGPPSLLGYLTLVEPVSDDEGHDGDFLERSKPVSPMKAIEDLLRDPLKNLHETRRDCEANLWDVRLPAKLHGLSCWIDDSDVPSTSASRKLERAMRDPDYFARAFDRALGIETPPKPADPERAQ